MLKYKVRLTVITWVICTTFFNAIRYKTIENEHKYMASYIDYIYITFTGDALWIRILRVLRPIVTIDTQDTNPPKNTNLP